MSGPTMPIANPLMALTAASRRSRRFSVRVTCFSSARALGGRGIRRGGRFAGLCDQQQRHDRAGERHREERAISRQGLKSEAQRRGKDDQRRAGGHAQESQRGVDGERASALVTRNLPREPRLLDGREGARGTVGAAPEAPDSRGRDQHREVGCEHGGERRERGSDLIAEQERAPARPVAQGADDESQERAEEQACHQHGADGRAAEAERLQVQSKAGDHRSLAEAARGAGGQQSPDVGGQGGMHARRVACAGRNAGSPEG